MTLPPWSQLNPALVIVAAPPPAGGMNIATAHQTVHPTTP